MELGLSGARALISGGSRGIGLAVAKALLGEGASVAISARGAKGIEQALAELAPLGKAVGQVCDVSDYDAAGQWVGDAAKALGGIDVVVINASAGGQQGTGPKPWRANFEIDVMSGVAMAEAALPHLEQSERAAIVQIATITAFEDHDVPGMSASYGAMKAAAIRHMAQIALRWGDKGIRANTVSPGPIYFEGGAWQMIEKHMPALYERDRDAHPSKRMGTAEEVASVVCFLASPAARWVSGANVVVDGGFTKGTDY